MVSNDFMVRSAREGGRGLPSRTPFLTSALGEALSSGAVLADAQHGHIGWDDGHSICPPLRPKRCRLRALSGARTFIASLITEGSNVFIVYSGLISQAKAPLSTHVFRV